MIKIPNVNRLLSLGKAVVMSNRPELLFGASITATIGSVLLAAKGGYDARGIVEEHESGRRIKNEPPLTTKEKAKLTWLCYMPAVTGTVGALGATTGLHIVHVQEKKQLAQAALMAIDEVKQTAKQFERENIGFMDEEEKSKILEQRANKDGVAEIQHTDGAIEELYLVRDSKTGRDIWSNQGRIEEAVLHINNRLAKDGDAELNEFYSRAGFELIPEGDDIGWSGEFVELEWDSTTRDDGRPVRRFKFRRLPRSGYADR